MTYRPFTVTANGAATTSDARTQQLIEDAIEQLKIQNAHLAAITGDTRDRSDIPQEEK